MEINVGDSFDLTVQDAKEWMLSTDHEGVGVFEQTPVVIHPEGSPKRLALRADLDTMVDAMNNGWGSIRKIRREGHISLLQTSVKLCIKNNRPFTPRPLRRQHRVRVDEPPLQRAWARWSPRQRYTIDHDGPHRPQRR
jgi:hypothetical protein